MVKQTLGAFELSVFESLLLQVAQDLADVVMDLLRPFAGADPSRITNLPCSRLCKSTSMDSTSCFFAADPAPSGYCVLRPEQW